MPLIKIGQDKFPEWCEIDDIKILSVNGKVAAPISSPVFAVFVVNGECIIDSGNKTIYPSAGESFFFWMNDEILIESEKCKVVIIQGRWGEEIGSSGFFLMENSEAPRNIGDPVRYSRKTDFDNHYHDFDEVWIILEGSGKAVSEGKPYRFSAGDCILTKAGDHHDIPEVHEKFFAIYFETTLKGEKRLGHLWNHTHSRNVRSNL